MCPAHVIFPKKKQSPSFSRDLMKKRREKAVLVDRISRWLFPTRFDCCGHCCDVIAWPTNLLFFLTAYLKCTSSFWKGKRWSELDVDAQSGNFQIVSRISPAPLASYLIFMFKSLAVFCRFSFIHFSFHIFSFILLNIVYWALFGDHDLWWSSIFPKPRSSQILELLADGKWLLPIDGCWSTSNRCGCPRYQVSWCSDTRYGYGYESPRLTSSQLHSRISRKPRVCRRQKDPVYAGFTVILFEKSIATKTK